MSSQTFWQDLATFALLGLAVSYIIRKALGLVGDKKAGGCGSCGSCSSSKGNANEASTPQIVTIGGLSGRKTV